MSFRKGGELTSHHSLVGERRWERHDSGRNGRPSTSIDIITPSRLLQQPTERGYLSRRRHGKGDHGTVLQAGTGTGTADSISSREAIAFDPET